MDGLVDNFPPLLVVTAEDDMICARETVVDKDFQKNGGCLLLRTKRGSHLAFNTGAMGTGTYLNEVVLDFLDAARKTK